MIGSLRLFVAFCMLLVGAIAFLMWGSERVPLASSAAPGPLEMTSSGTSVPVPSAANNKILPNSRAALGAVSELQKGLVVVHETPRGPAGVLELGEVVAVSGQQRVVLSVTAGVWEVPDHSEVGDEWRIEEVWSRGARLRFFPVRVNGSVPQTLNAFAYDGVFVVCRDEHGNPLNDVSIHRKTYGRASPTQDRYWHPGNLGLLTRPSVAATDPLYLPQVPIGGHSYRLHSPGRFWKSVSGKETREEFAIELIFGPAGDLDILIENFQKLRGLYLILFREQMVVARYSYLDVAAHVLEGLPPGDYELGLTTAQAQPPRGAGLANSGNIRVKAGQTTQAILHMPTLPTADMLGGLSGTVFIKAPELWSDTGFFRQAQLVLSQEFDTPGFQARDPLKNRLWIAAMEMSTPNTEDGFRTWSMDNIPAGEYILTISPFGIRYAVTVVAGGVEHVDCVIPPLARTVVELSTALHGADMQNAVLFATAASGPHVLAETTKTAETDNAVLLTVVTLPGKLDIVGDIPGFPPVRRSSLAVEGWNYERIILFARPHVTLRAVDGAGTEVNVDWWSDITVLPESSSGHLLDQTVLARLNPSIPGETVSNGIFYFSEPGQYVFQFPKKTGGGYTAKEGQLSVGVESAHIVDVLVEKVKRPAQTENPALK